MSDLLENLDGLDSDVGSQAGPSHDPWLHFTITSGSVPASGASSDSPGEPLDAWADQGDRPSLASDLAMPMQWPGDPGADPDRASMLVADLFRRRGNPAGEAEGPADASSLGLVPGARPWQHASTRPIGGEVAGQSRLPRFPEIGDSLFGFRLRYPLGRGAFARVFLAEQSDLAGRPVVVKVSAIEGTEPQTLAQLQHTNIVPIYSVHEDPGAGLRAVCMPYFGGASLSAVLQRVWSGGTVPVRGEELVTALEAIQPPPPESLLGGEVRVDLEATGTAGAADACAPLARLREWSYLQATIWIVAQLAEGLHHAHQRGILHRDVKPSNILLSAEGQPLLLDFNLAQDEHIDPALATLGGTVAYMAPEHLRALVGRSAALIRQVDHRSDIYSLGMVLAEMLTGESPFDQSASYSAVPLQIEAMALERSHAAPSARDHRGDVPWGLESIVRKCMAPDPSRRYQQADHLAEDLRRLLDERPLRYAPELSRVERARKFLRRHPRLTSSATITVAALAALLAVGSALAGARDRLGVIQARERWHDHEQGTLQALCLVNTAIDLQDHLREGADVCERTLALYKVPAGRRWEDHPDLAHLRGHERRKLAEDRRELLMLLAGARVRLAPGDRAARRQALRLLDQAEAIQGLPPSRALRLERADELDALGLSARAAATRALAERTPATTARDHYALATTYACQGTTEGLNRALAELDEALRLNPRHYWSLVQRGICHLELGESLLAAADFGQCIGLWPEFAWGYFNRGCVLERVGLKSEAVADFTAALRRDPKFTPALINRGLALLELKRHDAALADFDRALGLGRRDASLEAARGIALEGLKRHAEADAAFARAFAIAPARPDPARARLCWTYGFAVADRLPNRARAAFDDVLLQDPSNPQALYGRAMLAVRRGKIDEAIAAFNRALEVRPGFNEARRSRAVLLARQGDWDHAAQDINWCLEREPSSGETLYQAACVAALAAKASPTPHAADQALDLLRRAIDHGAEPTRIDDDPDLAGIRDDSRVRALLGRTEMGSKAGEASTTIPIPSPDHEL